MVSQISDYELICRRNRESLNRKLLLRRMTALGCIECSLFLIVLVNSVTGRCHVEVASTTHALLLVLKACFPCTVIIALAAIATVIYAKINSGKSC